MSAAAGSVTAGSSCMLCFAEGHSMIMLSQTDLFCCFPPRPGQGQVGPQPYLLQRGGDPVVPASRCPAGIHRLLHSSRHMVSTDYSNSAAGCDCVNKVCFFWIRGAGCIFIEMLQGAPAFPGVSDEFEQLQKIWEVSNTVYITDPRNSTTVWYYTVIILTLSTNTIKMM